MERRKQPYIISKPQIQHKPLDVHHAPSTSHQAPSALPQSNAPRPLSDIRELSEPSIIEAVVQRINNANERNFSARKPVPMKFFESSKENEAAVSNQSTGDAIHNPAPPSNIETSSSYSSTPEQSSCYTVPYSSVPRRSSSQPHSQRPTRNHVRKPSIRTAPPPLPKFEGFTVPNRGQSHSPVKQAAARSNPVKSDVARRLPSRTYIRTTQSADILQFPSYRHPRVKLELRVSAPLFVGGGSIEGLVHVTIDENERSRSRRSLAIGDLTVDLLGFEDMSNGRRAPFLAVGTDLIDTSHPPPTTMIEPPNPLVVDERFWALTPSFSALPFMISLPLNTGPPPFQSKIANIRFLLCATALISDAGKHYRVRTSQDVSVIATYDPEKALTSLSSPLTASDELSIPRFGRCESLKITAGLHRQVWVSGSSIFVDVHIVNRTHKPVKRLELNLERDILCYKHPPAGTSEKSASHARIFESNEQAMVARSSMKPGLQGWKGVSPYDSETRTCELELPRGHATVRCGKYFEVRFFLNITASLANTKLVTVQLPIILIHMNSLDVLPNSVAQVAAAIEEKRAHRRRHGKFQSHARQHSSSSPVEAAQVRRRPSYSQGRAFAAPRQQSTARLQTVKSDLQDLGQVLDCSPRKFGPVGNRQRAVETIVGEGLGCYPRTLGSESQGTVIRKTGSSVTIGAFSLGAKDSGQMSASAQNSYMTPPGSHSVQSSNDCKGLRNAGSLNQLPRMHSLDSMWSRRTNKKKTIHPPPGKQDQNIKPQFHFSLPQKCTEPHALNLTHSNRQSSGGGGHLDATPRPGTAFSFREKLERKRVEVETVIKHKASGALKDRRMNWLDPVLRHRDKEDREGGWI